VAQVGKAAYWVRYFSAWWGVLAVPMVYVTGRRWEGSETVGLWAAANVALAPFLIYYSQVTRTYSQGVAACLGTAYFALRAADAGRLGTEDPGNRAGFLLSGAIALHSFYHSALVLLALFMYLVAIGRRRMRAMAISVRHVCLSQRGPIIGPNRRRALLGLYPTDGGSLHPASFSWRRGGGRTPLAGNHRTRPKLQRLRPSVRARRPAGGLRDAMPTDELRPTSSWQPGEKISDHHGWRCRWMCQPACN
jgi:hypothetical protein